MKYLITGLLIVGGVIAFFYTDSGQRFYKWLTIETDIALYDCDKVADVFVDEEFGNHIRGYDKVIAIRNMQLVSHDGNMIVCSGVVSFSNGLDNEMYLTVESHPNKEFHILYRMQVIE